MLLTLAYRDADVIDEAVVTADSDQETDQELVPAGEFVLVLLRRALVVDVDITCMNLGHLTGANLGRQTGIDPGECLPHG